MDYEKYREEQEGEIEALHSIYVDEISRMSLNKQLMYLSKNEFS